VEARKPVTFDAWWAAQWCDDEAAKIGARRAWDASETEQGKQMKFRNANERALYRETVAAVTAQLIHTRTIRALEAKPAYVAHLACEYAIAAVHQLRTTEKAK
jgi:hypothetical protein